jgi:hypothetical protein
MKIIPIRALWREFKDLSQSEEYRHSLIAGFAMLLVSFFVSYFAAGYATQQLGGPIGDIFASTIPTFHVYGLYVYGPMVFLLGTVIVCFRFPKVIPFAIKAAALFVLVRAFMVTFTHLGLPPGILMEPKLQAPEFFKTMFLRGDLFFSGHAGFPFLFALIFWKYKTLRIGFILWSIFLSIIVILGHYHYTIDVAAAFFITYTIFVIARQFFAKDYAFSEIG